MAPEAITTTSLPFPLLARGKVRDVYDVGGGRLLIVATDRLSAFDVVMAEPIPWKGEVLTQATAWWLARLADVTEDHMLAVDPDAIVAAVPGLAATRAVWARRSMLVRRTTPFPIECVVRGYLTGSAWKEYRRSGTLAGESLPSGLVESARLDPPIFSPATKAETGHDENITFAEVERRLGADTAAELRRRSLAIYGRGREIAERAGIIMADTKFEFGRLPDGTILLIDEVLTPDSSRFWPRESYAPGGPQPSLDKQPVRDYLDALTAGGAWDKAPPPPPLPPDVVQATSLRYRDLFRRLTGVDVDRFAAGVPAPAT
jgi:phosphoribosylaminoimidazole-succinocarboxamide synthase